jgi:hypothetical protein
MRYAMDNGEHLTMASRFQGISLIRERIAQIRAVPEIVAQRVAPMIEVKLTTDATTKRGNVPAYGKFGDIPITAKAMGPTIEVSAVDWVLKNAQERGQVGEWIGMVQEVSREELDRGSK